LGRAGDDDVSLDPRGRPAQRGRVDHGVGPTPLAKPFEPVEGEIVGIVGPVGAPLGVIVGRPTGCHQVVSVEQPIDVPIDVLEAVLQRVGMVEHDRPRFPSSQVVRPHQHQRVANRRRLATVGAAKDAGDRPLPLAARRSKQIVAGHIAAVGKNRQAWRAHVGSRRGRDVADDDTGGTGSGGSRRQQPGRDHAAEVADVPNEAEARGAADAALRGIDPDRLLQAGDRGCFALGRRVRFAGSTPGT
jgi:hypothetical protein